jgi:hypothetical protein
VPPAADAADAAGVVRARGRVLRRADAAAQAANVERRMREVSLSVRREGEIRLMIRRSVCTDSRYARGGAILAPRFTRSSALKTPDAEPAADVPGVSYMSPDLAFFFARAFPAKAPRDRML